MPRYEPRNGVIVHWPGWSKLLMARGEAGILETDRYDPYSFWGTCQSVLVDDMVKGRVIRPRRPLRIGAWVGGGQYTHRVRPGINPAQTHTTTWEGGDWMLGIRGREAMGRATPQDPPSPEWCWDLTTFAPRDQWYPLGRKLEAKEREAEGLVALGDLDAEAEDGLARLEKWTVLLTAKHGKS